MSGGFVEHVEDAFGCGALGPVVVLVWRELPTPERVERCYAAFERASRRAGRPVGMLAILEVGALPPSLSLLPSIAREFDRQTHIHATAGVLEDRGPLAGRLLDVLTMISTLWKRRHPAKFCTDAREAIAWLAVRLEITPDPRGVLDVIEQVRDAMPLRGS